MVDSEINRITVLRGSRSWERGWSKFIDKEPLGGSLGSPKTHPH